MRKLILLILLVALCACSPGPGGGEVDQLSSVGLYGPAHMTRLTYDGTECIIASTGYGVGLSCNWGGY